MALQGTFDTFPLPDVLALLAGTAKQGRLEITGRGGAGTLWIDGSSITGAVSGSTSDPVEVLVALLRIQDGEFLFEAGEAAPSAGVDVPYDQALSIAAEYIAEWAGVESLLPSPDHVVALRRALAGPEVTISAATWSGLVAVGGGGSVRDLLPRFGDDDLISARAIAGLVEAGLLEVVAPVGGTTSTWLGPVGTPAVASPAARPAPAVERPAPAIVSGPPPGGVPLVDLVATAGGADTDEEIGTGQPWRDQVRQLLGTTQPEDPPSIVVERFGPSHARPPADAEVAAAPIREIAPTAGDPAGDAVEEDDRDALLKFLGSVQK